MRVSLVFLRAAAVAIIAIGAALGQTPEKRTAFEAASVKLNTSGSDSSSSHGTKGQVVMTNQSLKRLIERAYGVKSFQVQGASWLEGVHVDVVAKYPPDTQPDDRTVMLRSLLEDRFKLVVHHESKELSGYELVPAKGGFKLKPVMPGDSSMSSHGGSVRIMKASKLSMTGLADFVARNIDSVVIDKTGIDGVYDFELHWAIEEATDLPEPVPSIFMALQETLGLRLAAQKVPVEMIVVDHIERVPIEN